MQIVYWHRRLAPCREKENVTTAILLIGGDKTGNDRWYDETVSVADKLYDERLAQLRREGLNHD